MGGLFQTSLESHWVFVLIKSIYKKIVFLLLISTRLNSPMHEVVKKEIIKWLDTKVVYPIFASKWVCLVQCIPKKRGMTVVANEKYE